MVDAIDEMKIRARLLQRRIQAKDEAALQRLRIVPRFRTQANHPAIGSSVQRKDCLDLIARELGFGGWMHCQRVLRGDPDEDDFGTLLYPRACSGFINQWFARYEEARRTRSLTRGYLLAYRRQFVVVEAAYVEALGLSPGDPDWVALGWDWVRPAQLAARQRLYGKLLATLPPETAAAC